VLRATRSRSNFLHRVLGRHPDIFIPESKCHNRFNRDGLVGTLASLSQTLFPTQRPRSG
jgi:hypothetical protein